MNAALAGAPDARARAIRCGGCGATHSAEAWQTLVTTRTLTSNDLRRYVVAWPDDRTVEVRECSVCRQSIARLR